MNDKNHPLWGWLLKNGVVIVMSCSKGGINNVLPPRDSTRIVKTYILTLQR